MTVDWAPIRAEATTWTVIVRDNFHYMDPKETYAIRGFATAQEALAKCRRLVEISLQECAEPGRDAAAILACYKQFGDDPYVVSPAGEPQVEFSGWSYAREAAAKIVQS